MNTTTTRPNHQQTLERAERKGGTEDERVAVRPCVDVLESDAEYLIVADVPGVTRDAIDVHLEHGELRIEARRPAPAAGQALAEALRAVDYFRAFAIPDGIDPEKIDAELANGVLKVHVPKTAAKRPRRIDIRAS